MRAPWTNCLSFAVIKPDQERRTPLLECNRERRPHDAPGKSSAIKGRGGLAHRAAIQGEATPVSTLHHDMLRIDGCQQLKQGEKPRQNDCKIPS
ncbi:hypothetical protein DPEC_G00344660 [Dallia pectoralis]|uniref:Uncharacterized protein n=1 Tax=Dallia pectoralis TaxID=75939 RepID=A0ACC2F3B6_DALPE|nr:hypothetical protein DPEC_G00344660 [Dallia pectoralis]